MPLSLDVCLTVDLEPDCPPYLWTWRGLREGAPALLDLLARHDIVATFFTTGDTAANFPATIEELVLAGHELACHGMTHQPFTELPNDRADWEITQAARLLRRFAKVSSFRAPYLLFPPSHLRLLERAGFVVDSSQAKYKPSSLRPAVTSLLRIPVSVTSSVLRLPAFIRDPWLDALRSPVVLFVHPWEFVDLTATDLRLDCRFRTGQPALRALESVIALFKRRGARFCRIDTLAQDMRSAG
jgi:peptidoglycan-N-acetylglucosamine deacetylase